MRGVGDKKLAGRRGVSLEVEEYAVNVRFGMIIFAFRYRIREGSIAVHELECIVGQFAQIMVNGLVRTMNGCVESRVKEVDPIGFRGIAAGLHTCVGGQVEGVRIARVLGSEGGISRIRYGNTIIAIRLGRCHIVTRREQ